MFSKWVVLRNVCSNVIGGVMLGTLQPIETLRDSIAHACAGAAQVAGSTVRAQTLSPKCLAIEGPLHHTIRETAIFGPKVVL